jgi:hypothetical protein
MSSKLVGIVGSTGTGKSTSIKHLNPEETYIINVAKKELPFKGSEKFYNVEKRNYVELDDANDISRKLKAISEKAPHIKNIILEDSNYVMGFTMLDKAMEKGYEKFSVMARDTVTMIKTARQLRDDMTVFYFSHPDTIEDGGDIIGYKMKTSGKLIDNQINLEGLFTVVLYTNVEENKDGSIQYGFLTNRFKKIPAKSPDGMFSELKIPNDLQLVVNTLNEYYNA